MSHPAVMPFYQRGPSTYYRPGGSARVFLVARGDARGCAETSSHALGWARPVELDGLAPELQADLRRWSAEADRLVAEDERQGVDGGSAAA